MKTKKAVFLALALLVVLAALPWQRAAAEPKRYYVTQTGTGSGIGGWGAASSDLKGIMDSAGSGDEIWVAKGTYSPGGNETDTFLLKQGVKVYGGFAGTEGSVDARDWKTNITTLDGGGKVYNVVRGGTGATTADTRLDGFTITGGNANGTDSEVWYRNGGGMYNRGSSPTVANCVFSGNTAKYSGGGMYNTNSNPAVENCVFFGNTATNNGGGMYNIGSSPTVTNCTFFGNTATNNGGGMGSTGDSNPTLMNCTFSGNRSNEGGGLYNFYYSNSILVNCTFSGNTATNNGGGISNIFCVPYLANCTFSGNTATNSGGGMYNYNNASPTVANSILWGNTSAADKGLDIYQSGSTLTLKNCVVGFIRTNYGTENISGLIQTDPKLVALDKEGNTVTNPAENPAKVYIYGLGDGSSAIDKGLEVGTNIDEYASACVYVPDKDQRGMARPQGAGVDIGAFEAAVPVTGVTVDPKTLTLTAGGATGTLTATVYPADATNKNVTWASSNEAVATVADGVVTPIAAGQAVITVKTDDGNKTDTCTVNVQAATVLVTGVTVSPETLTLTAGGATGTLTATVLPPNATNQGVTWSSGNGAVATVANGVVTPIAAGQAIITVETDDGNKTATCTVNVQAAPVAVTGVTVSPATLTLTAGGVTGTLTATVLPADATNKNVTWSSGNEAIATVADGVVTPKAAGQAIITVKTVDGEKTATCTVTVNAAPVAVTGVTLAPATLTLTAGGATGTLTATVLPADATNKNVTWSSGNGAVATVANGVVTPKAAGQAIITVETDDGNKTATCTVNVQAAPVAVTGVTVSPATLTLTAGGATGTLTATVLPADAANKNVTWASSNEAIATVADGVVTPKAPGQATITVKTDDGNKTAACTVTVSAAGAQYTTVSGDGQTHTRGDGEDLLLTVERNMEDEKTFGLFRQMLKDGVPVAESNYTRAAGSLIIRLKSAWLDTLAAGLHHLSFVFEDGLAQASFTIRARPGSFEDVTTPSDSFTFTKRWQGGTGKSIDWTLYDEMDRVAHKLFNKKVVSSTEWRYNAWFDRPVSRYVVEKPVSGYKTRYENVGVYAGITDRCCDGGAIINYKIPKTGDEANLALWAGLALLGVAGISAVLVTGRRRRKGK
jgi:LPXTG-motif cell wall-anchored protein